MHSRPLLLQADESLGAQLGKPFVESYCKLKMRSWAEYSAHLTQWELDTTLDV